MLISRIDNNQINSKGYLSQVKKLGLKHKLATWDYATFASKENLEKIISNAEHLNIPITIFDSNIFEVIKETKGNSPCYLCARMRRGCLYSKAKELGCNKIALGHHFDDVIETILLSILYGGEYKGMMPKLKSTNFENMELIRPMYYIREHDIKRWVNGNNLTFLNCACKFTEKENYENKSKRKEMKELIAYLKKLNPNADYNIFKTTFDINLNTVLGYHKGEEEYSFLDDYDTKK